MTLIEIVAGLVILGTILASLAVARGRFARQWRSADQKLVAVRALDGLIADWLNVPGGAVPLNRQAAVADAPAYVWRTTVLRDDAAAKLSAAVVRVEIFERRQMDRGVPVASVDLMVHVSPTKREKEVGP
jgi:hypothetical protein